MVSPILFGENKVKYYQKLQKQGNKTKHISVSLF